MALRDEKRNNACTPGARKVFLSAKYAQAMEATMLTCLRCSRSYDIGLKILRSEERHP